MTTKQTISFRTEKSKRSALDRLADSLGRDRSYILNQAIDNFIAIYDWQKEHIKKGKQQAKNNNFVEESKWREAFNRDRK